MIIDDWAKWETKLQKILSWRQKFDKKKINIVKIEFIDKWMTKKHK